MLKTDGDTYGYSVAETVNTATKHPAATNATHNVGSSAGVRQGPTQFLTAQMGENG